MLAQIQQSTTLESLKGTNRYVGRFTAMSCDCKVLMNGCRSLYEANTCLTIVSNEAWRIERKFSRFRDDSVTAKLNRNDGAPVTVDDETARLIDCADQLYRLSDGLFDVTSGCLREAWVLDRSDRVPHPDQVETLLPRIGWDKVEWRKPVLSMPVGMELDFGGVGKEYAVDRCISLVEHCDIQSVLVNLGGDIATSGPQTNGEAWRIGIHSVDHQERLLHNIELTYGGVATSGDARRYVEKNGHRYSHVLNPKTGWPVENAPASVTVIGSNCTEAGMCSTLALLQGKNAEQFLRDNNLSYWIQHRELPSYQGPLPQQTVSSHLHSLRS